MPGKYRPIGVAEKRAMLEAAGEEWPIGSDGLPKIWNKTPRAPDGGRWSLRSSYKTARFKYNKSDKGRTYEKRRLAEKNEWYRSKSTDQRISPGVSPQESGSLGAAMWRWKKLSSPGNLRVLEKHDPRTAGLIKVAFGEGSTDNERLVAKRKLWAQQQGGRQTWQDQQTTSNETRNTPRETKSLPTSASSLGE